MCLAAWAGFFVWLHWQLRSLRLVLLEMEVLSLSRRRPVYPPSLLSAEALSLYAFGLSLLLRSRCLRDLQSWW